LAGLGNLLDLDFFIGLILLLLVLLALGFLLVAALEVLGKSRSWSARASPPLLLGLFVPGLSGVVNNFGHNRRICDLVGLGHRLHHFLLLLLLLFLDLADDELFVDLFYDLKQDEQGVSVSVVRGALSHDILLVNFHNLRFTFFDFQQRRRQVVAPRASQLLRRPELEMHDLEALLVRGQTREVGDAHAVVKVGQEHG